MTLSQLEAFITVVAMGTFTAAGEKIGMSQPAISDLVKRLEVELGTKLFQRSGRTVVLTAAGGQLLPYAQQSVLSAQEGMKAIRSTLTLDGGTASFGLLGNAGFYMTAALAKRFRVLHPNVRIRLTGQNSAQTAVDVSSGALEAGLVTLPVDDSDLEVFPLVRDEVVYISADPEHTRRPPSIDDLCAVPLVLCDAYYGGRDPARRQLEERAQFVGKRIDAVIEVEYLGSALSLVIDGFGDTFACRAAIATEVEPRGLHYVSFQEPMFDTLAFIKRRNQVLSAATKEMARLAYTSLLAHQASPSSTVEVLPTMEDGKRFFA